MKTKLLTQASMVTLLSLSIVSANINIPTVFVDDAGNAADTTGFGSVSYDYRIGTHEVTNAQYSAFLNDVATVSDPYGLWDSDMLNGDTFGGGINRSGTSGNFSYAPTPGGGDEPVRWVSFWDAARFANWLSTGDTENGVYTLGGVPTPTNTNVSRNASAFSGGG